MKNIFQFEAMTTPCEVVIYLKDKDKAREIAKEILISIKELEKKYNYYAPNSLLSQINNREIFVLDLQTKEILQKAKSFYTLTEGVFDITTATLKPLLHAKSLEVFYEQRERLSPYVGCEHYSIKKNKILFDNPFTKLDLGGFIKEYAVDKAVHILRKRKITSALVNFGGDIYALGNKPEGDAFKIGIKDPKNTREHLTFVDLCDAALTTSASYERNFTIEDRTFSHIISRQEPQKEFSSISVISPSALISGVYSTALNINASLALPYQTIKIDTNSGVHYENFTR